MAEIDRLNGFLSDIRLVFGLLHFLPRLFLPLRPFRSAELDELFPSSANLRETFFHFMYIIFQLAFLITLPFCLFSLFLVVAYVAAFIQINNTLCTLTLNGRAPFITSNVDISNLTRHDNERWIFFNGIGVGRHWLQSNVNLLAKTFGREILGVHNPTYGIVFDIIQCLIRRNFLDQTQQARNGYTLVKRALEDPKCGKVVLILHSQGAIQGSFIIDELVNNLSKADIDKLEVYTFAAAANYFNNTTCIVGRPKECLIRHIEHYANSRDFVSRLGVLNFYKAPAPASPPNQFIGKLFERPGGGHMLNQHYLDTMFPFDPKTGRVADTNDFMEMVVDETTVLGGQNVPKKSVKGVSRFVIPQSPGTMKPISELSRLWKYHNGMLPEL